jgi:hypothetical protein
LRGAGDRTPASRLEGLLVIGLVLTTQMPSVAGVGDHFDQAVINSGSEC